MMNIHQLPYALGLGAPAWIPVAGAGLLILVIWSVLWKGLALWHSARRAQPWWFVILLVVNTAGILELIYLFGVAKLKMSDVFSAGR